MRVLRKILPGILAIAIIGLAAYVGVSLAHDRSWVPPRNTGTTRALAVLFLVCDFLVGTAMVGLLLTRDTFPPKRLEWLFPLRGKWLWYTLFSLSVAAYAALAPVFLFFLASLRRP
jgi:hypothetical protein